MVFDAASPGPGNALQSYGPDGFTINGQLHDSAILLAPSLIAPWSGELTLEALAPFWELSPAIEVLIIGTGTELYPLPPLLRQALRSKGIAVDAMGTGAACRTYSVLHSEGRRVAAALRLPQ